MSNVFNISDNWRGFNAIRRLVIFGDSYSSVNDLGIDTIPDVKEPLGVPFPGITWSEPDRPNWIGHLITKYCPEPRYIPSNAERYGCPTGDEGTCAAWARCPLLVHDYARGGDKVPGVEHQVRQLFLPAVGKKPEWALWTSTETLFITWVGINDCAFIDFEGIKSVVERLLRTQIDLYAAGARNFLFVDVPTIHRSPAGKILIPLADLSPHPDRTLVPAYREELVLKKIQAWNVCLQDAVKKFATEYQNATVLLFSSFEAFDTLLNNPEEHGFQAKDLKLRGGSVWRDHIHPTSRVHDYVAIRIAAFLGDIEPASAVNESRDVTQLQNSLQGWLESK